MVKEWTAKPAEKRRLAALHDEDGVEFPAKEAFKWGLDRGGERIALTAFKAQSSGQRGLGLVLTHDCEIENDPSHHVVVAMVRPLSDLQEGDRGALTSGHNRAGLYLPGAQMGDLFVDFRRLTSYRQEALRPGDKIGTMTQVFRNRLNVAFYRFLFRQLPGGPPEP